MRYHPRITRRGLSAPADTPKHFSHVYHLPCRLDGGVDPVARPGPAVGQREPPTTCPTVAPRRLDPAAHSRSVGLLTHDSEANNDRLLTVLAMGRQVVTGALKYGDRSRGAPQPTKQMPIYIFKTALAFHIFEDQQDSNIQRKVAQFATWEQLLGAIRSDFQGRQIVPQF